MPYASDTAAAGVHTYATFWTPCRPLSTIACSHQPLKHCFGVQAWCLMWHAHGPFASREGVARPEALRLRQMVNSAECPSHAPTNHSHQKREISIDNLLVRIHFIIEMIWWTGLAPWEFEFPFPGSHTSTFQHSHQYLTIRARSTRACTWVRRAYGKLCCLQGYLAHKKQPPSLGPP